MCCELRACSNQSSIFIEKKVLPHRSYAKFAQGARDLDIFDDCIRQKDFCMLSTIPQSLLGLL